MNRFRFRHRPKSRLLSKSLKDANAPLTGAEIGRDYCDKLFHIEKELKDLSPEERKLKRLELEKPVLDAFWCWAESLNTLKGSALGKAVTYAINQKPYMENYLLDGRCSLSNNAAENAIRPFTVGRKNWLFAIINGMVMKNDTSAFD